MAPLHIIGILLSILCDKLPGCPFKSYIFTYSVPANIHSVFQFTELYSKATPSAPNAICSFTLTRKTRKKWTKKITISSRQSYLFLVHSARFFMTNLFRIPIAITMQSWKMFCAENKVLPFWSPFISKVNKTVTAYLNSIM